jgi:hypothetical protein
VGDRSPGEQLGVMSLDSLNGLRASRLIFLQFICTAAGRVTSLAGHVQLKALEQYTPELSLAEM